MIVNSCRVRVGLLGETWVIVSFDQYILEE